MTDVVTAPGRPVPQPAGDPMQLLAELRADPPAFLTRLRDENGPLVRIPFGPAHVYLASDPAMVADVLVTSARAFPKGVGAVDAARPLARLLGQGLLTSGGDLHRSQRRLLQPTFHHERIAGYGRAFAELAATAADGITDGAELDVHAAMTELTLAIVARTLFDVELDSEMADTIRRSLRRPDPSGPRPSVFLPAAETPAEQERGRRVRDDLRRVTEELIAARRARIAAGQPVGDDLLSLLVTAVDADTGAGMPDEQVRDEALTMLLAGHETTANALAWTFHLLGSSPEAEAALHAELDEVLAGGRLPTVADLPRLAWTDHVVNEALRLYPPAWMLVRRSVREHTLGGYALPAGSAVLMSPWVVHRDPELWPDPGRFDPGRWAPGGVAVAPGRPRFAWFPFGGGARQCIGNAFAQLEAVLATATLAYRWRLRPGPPVGTLPMVTLRPDRPLLMTAEARRPERRGGGPGMR